MKYIVKLDYDQEPDYNKLRKIFQDGLRKRRYTDDGKTVKFTAGELLDSKKKGSVEEKESDKSSADKVIIGHLLRDLVQETLINEVLMLCYTVYKKKIFAACSHYMWYLSG